MSDKLYQWRQPGLFRQTASDKANMTKAVWDRASWRVRRLPASGAVRLRRLFTLELHGKTQFYLPHWHSHITKLASLEDPASLTEHSATSNLDVGKTSRAVRWITELTSGFLCGSRCGLVLRSFPAHQSFPLRPLSDQDWNSACHGGGEFQIQCSCFVWNDLFF